MPRHNKHSAFTLIELLVAITIMVVMMTIVDQVYNSAGRAVSTGIGLSHIIANNRGVDAQITRDAECMEGPSKKGFLVIRYGQVNNVQMPNPNSSGYQTETIRNDQLVFVRSDGSGMQTSSGAGYVTAHPLMPYDSTTYASTTQNPSDIIVWYGHGLRTDSSGGFSSTPSLLGNGINRVGSQWILARQAMFLIPTATPYSGVSSSDPTWNGTLSPSYAGKSGANYQGLSDICHFNYASTGTGGKIVVGNSATDAGSPTPYLDANIPAAQNSQYQQNAIGYFTFNPNDGMWVCPSPLVDASHSLQPWQVAQMHGILAMNVSDFQIAFAMSSGGGSSPDRETNGNIKWYVASGFQNNNDSTNPLAGSYDSSQPTTYAAPTGYTYYDPSYQAFVWRHDDTVHWPFLIRIRYRMHDSQGRVTSGQKVQGMWFEHIIKVPR